MSRTLCLLAVLGLALPASLSARPITVPYSSCFARSAADYKLPEDLLIAVSAAESNWDPNARSKANAHGLMQIRWPLTAKHLGVERLTDLYKPCTNIELGARYLRELLDIYSGDERLALAAYNYGPSRIRDVDSVPPGAQKYIASVLKQRRRLSQRVLIKPGEVGGAVPAGTQQVLVVSSRFRAERYTDMLSKRVRGATFSQTRTIGGEHAIVMQISATGLSASDLVVLKTMGWEP